ncbi:unnamed protein product [Mesocestoides corti]|uniref:PDZ domain-containing protein n=1 Tax=Mesocestoides corti TaxID=53468 RepID=A0A158QVN0_MESCO|nr:unnamed protein product [Mesocestoides corti]
MVGIRVDLPSERPQQRPWFRSPGQQDHGGAGEEHCSRWERRFGESTSSPPSTPEMIAKSACLTNSVTVGNLRPGDLIMRVGDVSTRGMGPDQVARLLRQAMMTSFAHAASTSGETMVSHPASVSSFSTSHSTSSISAASTSVSGGLPVRLVVSRPAQGRPAALAEVYEEQNRQISQRQPLGPLWYVHALHDPCEALDEPLDHLTDLMLPQAPPTTTQAEVNTRPRVPSTATDTASEVPNSVTKTTDVHESSSSQEVGERKRREHQQLKPQLISMHLMPDFSYQMQSELIQPPSLPPNDDDDNLSFDTTQAITPSTSITSPIVSVDEQSQPNEALESCVEFSVLLRKPPGGQNVGLGLIIVGYVSGDPDHHPTRMTPQNSNTHCLLWFSHIDDCIQVNGVDLKTLSNKAAANLLKHSGPVVHLTFLRHTSGQVCEQLKQLVSPPTRPSRTCRALATLPFGLCRRPQKRRSRRNCETTAHPTYSANSLKPLAIYIPSNHQKPFGVCPAQSEILVAPELNSEESDDSICRVPRETAPVAGSWTCQSLPVLYANLREPSPSPTSCETEAILQSSTPSVFQGEQTTSSTAASLTLNSSPLEETDETEESTADTSSMHSRLNWTIGMIESVYLRAAVHFVARNKPPGRSIRRTVNTLGVPFVCETVLVTFSTALGGVARYSSMPPHFLRSTPCPGPARTPASIPFLRFWWFCTRTQSSSTPNYLCASQPWTPVYVGPFFHSHFHQLPPLRIPNKFVAEVCQPREGIHAQAPPPSSSSHHAGFVRHGFGFVPERGFRAKPVSASTCAAGFLCLPLTAVTLSIFILAGRAPPELIKLMVDVWTPIVGPNKEIMVRFAFEMTQPLIVIRTVRPKNMRVLGISLQGSTLLDASESTPDKLSEAAAEDDATATASPSRHFVHSVLPNSLFGQLGCLQRGDEILQVRPRAMHRLPTLHPTHAFRHEFDTRWRCYCSVNGYRLHGYSHVEAVRCLRCLPSHIELVIARSLDAGHDEGQYFMEDVDGNTTLQVAASEIGSTLTGLEDGAGGSTRKDSGDWLGVSPVALPNQPPDLRVSEWIHRSHSDITSTKMMLNGSADLVSRLATPLDAVSSHEAPTSPPTSSMSLSAVSKADDSLLSLDNTRMSTLLRSMKVQRNRLDPSGATSMLLPGSDLKPTWSKVPLIVMLRRDTKGFGFSLSEFDDFAVSTTTVRTSSLRRRASTLTRRRTVAGDMNLTPDRVSTLPRSATAAGGTLSRPRRSVLLIDLIQPGGCVDRDGRLAVGDRLLFVNDRKLSKASLGEAATVLQNVPLGYTMIGVAKMKLVHATPQPPVESLSSPQFAALVSSDDKSLPLQAVGLLIKSVPCMVAGCTAVPPSNPPRPLYYRSAVITRGKHLWGDEGSPLSPSVDRVANQLVEEVLTLATLAHSESPSTSEFAWTYSNTSSTASSLDSLDVLPFVDDLLASALQILLETEIDSRAECLKHLPLPPRSSTLPVAPGVRLLASICDTPAPMAITEPHALEELDQAGDDDDEVDSFGSSESSTEESDFSKSSEDWLAGLEFVRDTGSDTEALRSWSQPPPRCRAACSGDVATRLRGDLCTAWMLRQNAHDRHSGELQSAPLPSVSSLPSFANRPPFACPRPVLRGVHFLSADALQAVPTVEVCQAVGYSLNWKSLLVVDLVKRFRQLGEIVADNTAVAMFFKKAALLVKEALVADEFAKEYAKDHPLDFYSPLTLHLDDMPYHASTLKVPGIDVNDETVVRVKTNGLPLGLELDALAAGGQDGCRVVKVLRGGAVEKAAALVPGDYITRINSDTLRCVSNAEAFRVLRKVSVECSTIEIAYYPAEKVLDHRAKHMKVGSLGVDSAPEASFNDASDSKASTSAIVSLIEDLPPPELILTTTPLLLEAPSAGACWTQTREIKLLKLPHEATWGIFITGVPPMLCSPPGPDMWGNNEDEAKLPPLPPEVSQPVFISKIGDDTAASRCGLLESGDIVIGVSAPALSTVTTPLVNGMDATRVGSRTVAEWLQTANFVSTSASSSSASDNESPQTAEWAFLYLLVLSFRSGTSSSSPSSGRRAVDLQSIPPVALFGDMTSSGGDFDCKSRPVSFLGHPGTLVRSAFISSNESSSMEEPTSVASLEQHGDIPEPLALSDLAITPPKGHDMPPLPANGTLDSSDGGFASLAYHHPVAPPIPSVQTVESQSAWRNIGSTKLTSSLAQLTETYRRPALVDDEIHVVTLSLAAARCGGSSTADCEATLGIRLVGHRDTNLRGVFVCSLREKSLADQTPGLQVTDEIVQVNNVCVMGLTHVSAKLLISKEAELARRGTGGGGGEEEAQILLVIRHNVVYNSSVMARPAAGTTPTACSHFLHNPTFAALRASSSSSPSNTTRESGQVKSWDRIVAINGEAVDDYDTALAKLTLCRPRAQLRLARLKSPAGVLGTISEGVRRPTLPRGFSPHTRPTPILRGVETTVEMLRSPGEELGFSIVGGADTLMGGVFIHQVHNGSFVWRDGRLKPGDQILAVGDLDLRQSNHAAATKALRETQERVLITILRGAPSLEDTASTLISLSAGDMLQTFNVTLQKQPGQAFGLVLDDIPGGVYTGGVVIVDVADGSPASRSSVLASGDVILEVDGIDVHKASFQDVTALLKTFPNSVLPLTETLHASLSLCLCVRPLMLLPPPDSPSTPTSFRPPSPPPLASSPSNVESTVLGVLSPIRRPSTVPVHVFSLRLEHCVCVRCFALTPCKSPQCVFAVTRSVPRLRLFTVLLTRPPLQGIGGASTSAPSFRALVVDAHVPGVFGLILRAATDGELSCAPGNLVVDSIVPDSPAARSGMLQVSTRRALIPTSQPHVALYSQPANHTSHSTPNQPITHADARERLYRCKLVSVTSAGTVTSRDGDWLILSTQIGDRLLGIDREPVGWLTVADVERFARPYDSLTFEFGRLPPLHSRTSTYSSPSDHLVFDAYDFGLGTLREGEVVRASSPISVNPVRYHPEPAAGANQRAAGDPIRPSGRNDSTSVTATTYNYEVDEEEEEDKEVEDMGNGVNIRQIQLPFVPQSSSNDVRPHPRLGLSISAGKGSSSGQWVVGVTPNSPAAQSGLRVGDCILGLDDRLLIACGGHDSAKVLQAIETAWASRLPTTDAQQVRFRVLRLCLAPSPKCTQAPVSLPTAAEKKSPFPQFDVPTRRSDALLPPQYFRANRRYPKDVGDNLDVHLQAAPPGLLTPLMVGVTAGAVGGALYRGAVDDPVGQTYFHPPGESGDHVAVATNGFSLDAGDSHATNYDDIVEREALFEDHDADGDLFHKGDGDYDNGNENFDQGNSMESPEPLDYRGDGAEDTY